MSSVKLIHVAGIVDIYVCALGEKYSSSRDFSKFFCYLSINFQPNIDSTPPPLTLETRGIVLLVLVFTKWPIFGQPFPVKQQNIILIL
jgi:hypothetical protein